MARAKVANKIFFILKSPSPLPAPQHRASARATRTQFWLPFSALAQEEQISFGRDNTISHRQ
jgi:hypothetical protein